MKFLKIAGITLGIGLALLIALAIAGLVIIGNRMPASYVYHGHMVPEKYLREIQSLGLLESDEQIKYFYSDALFDIKEGMYIATDRNLIAYNKEWGNEPCAIIPFHEITILEPTYNQSFFSDSHIYVSTDETHFMFPLSSERGRDKEVVSYIREMAKLDIDDAEPVSITPLELEPIKPVEEEGSPALEHSTGAIPD